MSYAQTFGLIHSKTDEVLQRALLENQHTPPCCEGCYYCCKEPVYCTRAEAAYMLELYAGGELSALRQKVSAWHEKFLMSGAVDETLANAFKYRLLNIWCPFLKDGKCSVYARRPTACRLHVAKETSAGCIDETLRKHQKFLLIPELDHHLGLMAIKQLREGETMIFDHLGIHLYNILFGFDLATKARMEVQVSEKTLIVKQFSDDEAATSKP